VRVFLPFAFAYFLSYIFRGVNAGHLPYLERDIGITAADLGLLTSAFFLFFALIQPLQGVMLDRYGPRRVQVVLLAVAAAGSALFGPQPLARRARRGARADRASASPAG
jgi:sugar phosphate permease